LETHRPAAAGDAAASAQLEELRDKAARLQAEGKWPEAQDAWDNLLKKSPAGDGGADDASPRSATSRCRTSFCLC